jgi:hypothetical protein
MKNAVLVALAVLGLSLVTTALAPSANAHTYLFSPNANSGHG